MLFVSVIKVSVSVRVQVGHLMASEKCIMFQFSLSVLTLPSFPSKGINANYLVVQVEIYVSHP